jgi:O-glycosyl hydrolase
MATTEGVAPSTGDEATSTESTLDDAAPSSAPTAGSATSSDDAATTGPTTPYVDPTPRPAVAPADGATLVKVEADKPLQSFEGWGTSLCWWANRVGGWSEVKRNAFLDAVTDPVTGLGYNVFRYNIGGGENPAHDHMDAYRDMPGFQPTQGTWDWEADARQVGVVRYLASKSDEILLEAFSNSPPYWMTKSGCASGNTDGSNNLKEDAYDEFADYLTEVVKHFRDEYAITFRTLEPLNEPNANWWKSDGSQEGCHFAPSNQERIIVAVGAQLAAKGLTETSVSASDENSLDDAHDNLRSFAAETLTHVSQLNVHSYNGTKRVEVRELAKDKQKRLWQSESGPLSVDLATELDAALFMAGRVITDLRDLQPAAWVDWQIQDPAQSWSSFTYNDNAQSFAPRKRYYMHASFSRYIRPGATFITLANAEMVAALSADNSYVSIVARNGDKATSRKFTFDLTSLRVRPTEAKVYRTSADEDLLELTPIATEDWSLTATLPPYSITTFVLELAP